MDKLGKLFSLRQGLSPNPSSWLQKSMLEYAPKAVNLVRPALEWQVRPGNPILRWIALNLGLPVADIALRLLNRE